MPLIARTSIPQFFSSSFLPPTAVAHQKRRREFLPFQGVLFSNKKFKNCFKSDAPGVCLSKTLWNKGEAIENLLKIFCLNY